MEELHITQQNIYTEIMDGVAWSEVRVTVDVVLKSNKDLSDLLDSIRLLRAGVYEQKSNKKTKRTLNYGGNRSVHE